MSLHTTDWPKPKKYIGCKIIKARPMANIDFSVNFRSLGENLRYEMGYMVEYPDGYKSWSPKEAFENAYREITDGEMKLLEG